MLSSGAVASADEVEEALRSLMQRLDDAAPEEGSIPDRTIKCVLPDLRTAYRSSIVGARFDGLEEVSLDEDADVTVIARSGDLVALVDGRLNIGFAFLTGKIRVEASTSDLMLIRRLF